MKKLFILLLVFILCATLFIACAKNDEQETNDLASDNILLVVKTEEEVEYNIKFSECDLYGGVLSLLDQAKITYSVNEGVLTSIDGKITNGLIYVYTSIESDQVQSDNALIKNYQGNVLIQSKSRLEKVKIVNCAIIYIEVA